MRLQCAQNFRHPFFHTSFSFLYEQKFRFSTSFCVFVFGRDFTITEACCCSLIVVHVVDVIELQHYKQGSFCLSSLFFLLFMLLLVTGFWFYFWFTYWNIDFLFSIFELLQHGILCAKKKRTETFLHQRTFPSVSLSCNDINFILQRPKDNDFPCSRHLCQERGQREPFQAQSCSDILNSYCKAHNDIRNCAQARPTFQRSTEQQS